ncbi:MAG: c-type cytochrome [Pseudomonadales bacterium]
MKIFRRAKPAACLVSTLIALSFASVSSTATAADPAAGAQKAHTCLGCHGVQHYVNTYPTYHVPYIAGQNEDYLVLALKAYRDKTRKHQTMQANASLLSDTDIADIAAYFANIGKK